MENKLLIENVQFFCNQGPYIGKTYMNKMCFISILIGTLETK